MVLLDRVTATLQTIESNHVTICSGLAAILNSTLLPAAVTHRIVSIC